MNGAEIVRHAHVCSSCAANAWVYQPVAHLYRCSGCGAVRNPNKVLHPDTDLSGHPLGVCTCNAAQDGANFFCPTHGLDAWKARQREAALDQGTRISTKRLGPPPAGLYDRLIGRPLGPRPANPPAPPAPDDDDGQGSRCGACGAACADAEVLTMVEGFELQRENDELRDAARELIHLLDSYTTAGLDNGWTKGRMWEQIAKLREVLG